MTDPDSDRGGAAVGRAAWSRRPPLTRERKNQHLPPSRAGRVTFSWTLTRWSCTLARSPLVTDPDSGRGGAADPRCSDSRSEG